MTYVDKLAAISNDLNLTYEQKMAAFDLTYQEKLRTIQEEYETKIRKINRRFYWQLSMFLAIVSLAIIGTPLMLWLTNQ